MPDSYDIASLYGDDEPTAQQKALAIAQALRGQNQQAQQQGDLGLIAQLTGNKQLATAGGGLISSAQGMQDQAQKGTAQLAEVSGSRLTKALAAKKEAEAAANLLADNKRADAALAETTAYHRGELANGRARIEKPAAGTGLTADALDQSAEQYSQTGQMDSRLPPATKILIANRAAELHPSQSLAGNKGAYRADTGSLGGLQKQSDSVDAFEGTALANLHQFMDQAKKVVDTGSPFFNAPARKFDERFAGDPKMTAFSVSRAVAVQEISKVLSGAMGNAAVSDGARHEVESLIGPDASLAQIQKAAEILTQDMTNRKAALHGQMATIHGRLSGKPANPQTSTAPHPQADEALTWAKAHPDDPRSKAILERVGAPQ